MLFAMSLPGRAPAPLVSVVLSACEDPRWPRLKARLQALRSKGRRSVRIVDVNCGDGGLLIRAASHARSLGFLAIEAVGLDSSTCHIEDARQRARSLDDLAIGLRFDVGEPGPQLEAEAEFPADILLFEAPTRLSPRLRGAVRRAGNIALRISPSQRQACT
ncbi:class I SAM-dependent methyltransferase [Novosphingobium lindaniclasticum]|nr:SAM-dependent methyltransferase [Novosphingobium lindaniclasticum]